MELNSKFVDLNIAHLVLSKHTLNLDGYRGSKWHSHGTTEREEKLINLLVISDDMLSHSERELESSG